MLLAAVAATVAVQGAWAQPADQLLAQPLQDLYAALEAAMRAGNATPFPRRYDALAPVIDRVFDLETVLKVSVGMRWDSTDPARQARLLRVYRQFTVATYVANFNRYDGERFQILPGLRDTGSDRIVATEIINGGERLRLDYVMRDGSGVWAGGGRAAGRLDQPGGGAAVGFPKDPGERRHRRADRQPASQDRRSVGWRPQFMIAVLAAVTAGVAAIGVAQALVASHLVGRFARRPADRPAERPPVTVLKPLHGDEPLLEGALMTLCQQDYPEWQVVFGVHDAADPAAAAVRRLQQRFPSVDMVLVADPAEHGSIEKLAILLICCLLPGTTCW